MFKRYIKEDYPSDTSRCMSKEISYGYDMESKVSENNNIDNQDRKSSSLSHFVRSANKRLDRYESSDSECDDRQHDDVDVDHHGNSKQQKYKKHSAAPSSPIHCSSPKRRLTRLFTFGDKLSHYSEKDVAAVLTSFILPQIETNDLAIAERTTYLNSTSNDKTEEIVVYNDPFCGTSLPPISLQDYIERILHYLTSIARVEKESGRDVHVKADLGLRYLIAAFIYIRRFSSVENFLICSLNIHRMLITAVTVASKMLDDFQPRNSYFARLGGISLQELNYFESVFCNFLKFNVTLQPEEFDLFMSITMNELEQRDNLFINDTFIPIGSTEARLISNNNNGDIISNNNSNFFNDNDNNGMCNMAMRSQQHKTNQHDTQQAAPAA